MFKFPLETIVELSVTEARSSNNVLFIVAGIEGNCDAFAELAEILTKENVITYGLNYTLEVPNSSIKDSASFYVKKISQMLDELGLKSFHLAGYSYGGIIALEMTRLMENQKNEITQKNLILFESSHSFFKIGVHVNAKKFGLQISNQDIFKRSEIFTGTLSIYLSHMIGRPDVKFEIYEQIKNTTKSLDDGINKAIAYLEKRSLVVFENETEKNEMKLFLRVHLTKSNAGFVYDFKVSNKLKTSVILLKSSRFIYKDLDGLYVRSHYDSEEKHELKINENNYDLNDICSSLKVIEYKTGNHWNFISENSQQIASFLIQLFNMNKSKL